MYWVKYVLEINIDIRDYTLLEYERASVVLITSRESIRSKLIVKRRHLLKQYSFDR